MSGGNALHDLISQGSIREALDLINSGAWLEEVDGQERTALMLAVKGGYVDLVKALIEKGVDLNKKDKYGRTALHYAALSRSEEISNMLFKAGIDPLIKDNKGKMASKYIPRKNYPDLYKLYKKFEKLQRIKNKKLADLKKSRKKASSENLDLNRALAFAINSHDADSIIRLIMLGADINTRGLSGATSLHIVIEKGKADFAQQLVDRGASLTVKDNLGKTPLKLAEEHGISITRTYVSHDLPKVAKVEVSTDKLIKASVVPRQKLVENPKVTESPRPKLAVAKQSKPNPVDMRDALKDALKDAAATTIEPPGKVIKSSSPKAAQSMPKQADSNNLPPKISRVSIGKVVDASHSMPLVPGLTPPSAIKDKDQSISRTRSHK